MRQSPAGGPGSRSLRGLLFLCAMLAGIVAAAAAASALPDLLVTLSPSANVPDGAQVTVNVTLTNGGDAASANASVALAIDGNPTDPPLEFPGLAAGASVTLSPTYPLPCGYHNVTASADAAGAVTEISESNNNATAVAKVLPVADFAAALSGALGSYNLTANASLSHGCAPLSFAWVAVPGGDFSGGAISFSVPAGNVSLTLTAASSGDATLAARTNRTVAIPNRSPDLQLGWLGPTVPTGTAVILTLAASDTDGSVDGYFVDFGDGNSTALLADASGHKYAQPGNYTVTVRVTDNLGASNETSIQIAVTNRPPVARVDPPYWYGETGQETEFNASPSNDPEGGPLSYQWQFGDGSSGNGRVVHHLYAAPAVYNAVLTVTDEHGATHSVTVRVQVLGQPPSPPGSSLLTAAFLIFLVVLVVVYLVTVRGRPGPPPPPDPGARNGDTPKPK